MVLKARHCRYVFFFKQKTAYDMRISDWSSDVCSPDLADDSWPGIRAARMAGLRTFHGNPVSEHADRRLDLIGIGWLLALSTRVETNTLACIRYQSEFGRDHVYRLRVLAPGEAPKQAQSNALQAPALFGDAVTHAALERPMSDGWSRSEEHTSELQ